MMSPLLYSLSDSEPEHDSDFETDQLIFNTNSAASTSSSQASHDKGKKSQKNKEEKEKLKEEKRRIAEEKKRLKEERKKAAELLKRLKPGECIKYVSVLLDSDLTNCKFGGELLVSLQAAEIRYKVEKMKFSHSILWMKELENESEKLENYLLVIWPWNELINSIASNGISNEVEHYIREYPNFKITLVIFGIEEYFRFQKTLKNRQLKKNSHPEGENIQQKSKKKEDLLLNSPSLTRVQVETSATKLQLLYDVQCRFVESGQDLGLFVCQYTKSLAELPFKMDRNRKHENTDWYATADSKESVKVDNDGNGLLRLWQQQICQFPNVGFDVAQSIVAEYNSPQALIEAYDKCKDRKEAELLLQDIPVRRSQGPLTSCRRIGPELSKKIFLVFNNLDGNIPLS